MPTPELDFELLPQHDDDALTPEQELDAAEAAAIEPPLSEEVPEEEDVPDPPGRSWAFDHDRRRMVRSGSSPAETRGLDTLAQRCLMAVHTARFAHPVFSDEFGMESPDDLRGETVEAEDVADWEERLREALLAVEGVSEVEFDLVEYDRDTGDVLTSFTVTSDDGATLPFDDLALEALR